MGFWNSIFGGNGKAELKQVRDAVQQLTVAYQQSAAEVTVLRQEVAEVKRDNALMQEQNNKLREEQGVSDMYTLSLEELVKDVHNTQMSEEEKHLKSILDVMPIECYRDYSARHRAEAHEIIAQVQRDKYGSVNDACRHKAWLLVYNRMRKITPVDLYDEYNNYYKPKHLFSGAYLDMVSKNELWFRIFKAAAAQVTIKERNEWSWQK